jgi:hypothetical protein
MGKGHIRVYRKENVKLGLVRDLEYRKRNKGDQKRKEGMRKGRSKLKGDFVEWERKVGD